MPRGRRCRLAPRPARRYKDLSAGGEGDAGAAVVCGRAVTKYRGFSVIDIEGKRVALYARHSNATQARSVPAQLHRLKEAARAGGATVVGEYADKAVTGAVLESRPAVQSLLVHAADGDFEAVLIEDLSRISRDQADVATIHKLLAFHGVALVSVTEGRIGALHIGLTGTMNSIHLEQLSDKVRRGQFAAVRDGRIPGGRIYGYELLRPEGTLETGLRRIEPKEAAIVRRIFAEAEEGKALRRIVDDLNRDAIPSPKGKMWSRGSLADHRGRGLLRQNLYAGRVVFGRFRVFRHPITGKREDRPQPMSKWIIIPAPADLAIVSEEQFDRVQRIVRTPVPRRPPPPPPPPAPPAPPTPPSYPTSGRTWCASCGGRVITAHSGYLICRTWRDHRACDQRHLFRREQIIEATLDYLVSPRCEADIASACEELVRNAETAAASTHIAVDTASDLVDRVHAEAAALDAAIAETVGMARVREHLDICTRDIATLRGSLQRLRVAATGTLPARRTRHIASAAARRIAVIVERVRAGAAAPGDNDVVQQIIEAIHVAYRRAGREGLEVRATVASHAAYRLGLVEVAPALLHAPRRGRHRAAPTAGPAAA